MSKVVLPTFGSLASDRDSEVRSRAVQLLVSLTHECSPEWCPKLIHIISEVHHIIAVFEIVFVQYLTNFINLPNFTCK